MSDTGPEQKSLPTIRPGFAVRRMENAEAMKVEEYRLWQGLPIYKRLEAVDEISRELFTLKGFSADEFRLQRTVKRIQR